MSVRRLGLPIMILLAMPASGQLVGSYRPRATQPAPRIDWGLVQIDDAIDDGRDSGQLSRRQAKTLRRNASAIGSAEARVSDMSDAEAAQFDGVRQAVREQVTAERLKRKPK